MTHSPTATRSDAEEALAFHLRAVGIPFVREFQFAPPRKWRADFLVSPAAGISGLGAQLREATYPQFLPSRKTPVLVEVDGGSWTGGRHTSGAGFEKDCEKQSAAAIAGYRVIRVTPKQVESGEALKWIEAAR